MAGSAPDSTEAAVNSVECEIEKKKAKTLKEIADLETRINLARIRALNHIKKLTAGCYEANEIDSQSEEDEKIFIHLKKLRKKYERHNKKDDPSSKTPSVPKVNQCERELTLKSTPVSRKVEKIKPLENTPAKKKTPIQKKRPVLCIDLTCEDVEEYFPEKLKVNLGHRCDSPSFHKKKFIKGVPNSVPNKGQIPVIRRSHSLEGVAVESSTSTNKENGSNHKLVPPQPYSLARKSAEENSSKFKMIRIDYKKDVGTKSSDDVKPSQ